MRWVDGGWRQHHRQASRYAGLCDFGKPRQIHPEHFLVEKQQRRLRLILGRRRHVALGSEMRQKRFDFRRPHVARMPLAVPEHEASRPVDISLLGADRIVLHANAFAYLIQQTRRARGPRRFEDGAHPQYNRRPNQNWPAGQQAGSTCSAIDLGRMAF